MDCETYEARVLELEERLMKSESRAATLEGRLRALGQELFVESYRHVGTGSELRNCGRVYAALEDFGASLAAIPYARVDPAAVAHRALESWQHFLMDEVSSIIRCGHTRATPIEFLCDVFLIMESGLDDVTLVSFVEAAKVDLLVYKFEVYRVFMGVSEKDARAVAECRQSIADGWGADEWGKKLRARFLDHGRLAEAQNLVFDAGIEAVHCFRKGDKERAFEALSRMEEASLAVWGFLDGFSLKGGNGGNSPSEERACH